MNIQPNINNNIPTGKAPRKPKPNKRINSIKQNIIDAFPSFTFKDTEQRISQWIKFEDKISKPAENRAVMGGTAIVLQPIIDASNKKVDNETRNISICRTIAKIIAGTGVGILVRGSSYKLVTAMTDLNGKSKYSKTLIPSKYIEELAKNPKLMKNYRSALSTGLAIGAMCITNFVLDAPLTVFLTNRFTNFVGLNSEQNNTTKTTPKFKVNKFNPEEVRDEKRA